ncbi:FAD-dependent oxidoreductase [Fodinicola feengrottensis]|uniref:FAD-dependent oxidoreductase n=1 Tax=Fodinicola feengrottensis TaxID=435914 RepID=UPI0013D039E3|nr:FAD-dependent monooxygenase [Fodinicola feengrottensis]
MGDDRPPRHFFPPDFSDATGETIRATIKGRIATWHPHLRRLIAESAHDQLRAVGFTAATPVPAWRTSNVTVLGDAIHHMPPVGGLGGNTALRDARLLCQPPHPRRCRNLRAPSRHREL